MWLGCSIPDIKIVVSIPERAVPCVHLSTTVHWAKYYNEQTIPAFASASLKSRVVKFSVLYETKQHTQPQGKLFPTIKLRLYVQVYYKTVYV